MKNISILVLKTSVTTSIMDAQYMFNAVNNFFCNMGKQPYFNVKLVGLKKDVKLNKETVTIHPEELIKTKKVTRVKK